MLLTLSEVCYKAICIADNFALASEVKISTSLVNLCLNQSFPQAWENPSRRGGEVLQGFCDFAFKVQLQSKSFIFGSVHPNELPACCVCKLQIAK